MEHLIDKSALVAEIERLRKNQVFDDRHSQGVLDGLHAIEKHLNSLEVKEVDLPTWEPICSFQYFSDNDIFIEDNCLRWGNMVISLDELKKLPKKS